MCIIFQKIFIFLQPLPARYIPRPIATVTTCDSSRRQNTASAQDLHSPGFTSIDSDRHSSRKQVQFGNGGGISGGDISPDLLHVHWKESNNTSSSKGLFKNVIKIFK